MASWFQDVPASAVVELRSVLDDPPRAPAGLRLRDRPGRGTRMAVVTFLLMAAGACVGLSALLWMAASPGWWFNALFTVLLLLLGLGAVAGGLSWHVTANAEMHARALWAAGVVRDPVLGHIVDRFVSTGSESGKVTGFVVRVESATGRWDARWHDVADEGLLQPQVPGIGSPAWIWASSTGPFVVELVDPTVVLPGQSSAVRGH